MTRKSRSSIEILLKIPWKNCHVFIPLKCHGPFWSLVTHTHDLLIRRWQGQFGRFRHRDRGKFRDAREKRMFGEKLAMEFWSLDHVWDYLEISLGLCWNYLEYFGITWTMWIIVWITWIILDGFSFNWSVLDYLDVWFHGFFLHLCSLLHSLGHFTAVHPGSGICVDPLHPPWFLGDIFLGGADGIFQ